MLVTDRVSERRRAAQLARHYRDQEGLTIAEIARRLGRAESTVKAYLYDPIGDKAREVKARYRGVCRGGSGAVRRCAPGERATAPRRPPMTGRAPTHAGAAAKRSNDYRPENGPRRRL